MHLLAGLVWAHASLVSVPVSQNPDTARDRPLLRVLAINDFHGALEPQVWPWSGGRAVGGAAALKSWLDSLTRTCGCATIRLDAGDEMQGTLISNYSFGRPAIAAIDRKSTRLNSSHLVISYAVFCLKKKKNVIAALTIKSMIPCITLLDSPATSRPP